MSTNELRFDDQVAVITGAGGGLGRQYALLLASRGARVVVNDTGGSVTGNGSNVEAASVTAGEIRERGGEAVADTNSVTSPEGAEAIVDTALRAWGRVDILINNAGIVGDAPFEDMTADRLQPLLDVHLNGAFYVTRPAWWAMRKQRYGRVLNTCSAAGILGAERMSNYGAAKTGLIGLTRVLAAEGAEHGIKVNAIAPIAYTRMLTHSLDGATGRPAVENDAAAQAVLDDLVGQYLQKLDPAHVAPVAAFLTHRDCPVSGEIYTVGAGHVARFFIGRTKGFYDPALSIEEVRDHLDEIRDEAGYTVPGGPADEMAELFATIATQGLSR
ncbi:SDR family NAD(P)-dependent oxidoreductase [Mycobacterium nebraskense]|uniref:Short-chain dehydrogenase n=1 Tax=Mycobacterium nebraskense TaxID=244292 RepID=A0A0F5NIK9_9MYCO|nr:SDR family NAD(P)-dependent oxidoreductase [Mycobacterium nebraskense]KKC06038.1 short-chain dehydrogenase [Mycobacterium nebraskense]KLO41679.1 short-chain dehydrogenase [Mycobacterium nebraskense]MBI2695172.1 SDR family NAD(P)-dependent oxidoreductase [Mycobacterium nebraskense]MCV7115733.1 SDR family NAD(P)-dependent oxidoreductase [Mycobacterium nebraskense]ORW33497.1 short-chain dehydrogenase [Mycobacterium nebraskense]